MVLGGIRVAIGWTPIAWGIFILVALLVRSLVFKHRRLPRRERMT